MEYDIEDWEIKIKIGGLGVMSQLMGRNLVRQDLIWVVPCVGGVEYPRPENESEVAKPMHVVVLGQVYEVEVRTHVLRNITYVLLDAPVFRKQTKAEPYPPRMDDMESAIYYSAWNSCIAEAIRRYRPDLYHINDYHGCVAPLHLLPATVPCALSLHNAEFQGLWPMRTKEERDEVCKIYNLDSEKVQGYVQFGEVFNLLHAGASYLRVHQKGFGAVGVSTKYGKRSYARYPIFWGLKGVGALPNPDPSDTAEWQRGEDNTSSIDIPVNVEFEAKRAGLRMEAQKWAGLKVDRSAELFVFVGRWSQQKGVDLIADILPTILEKHPTTQLICIGPVIDLYGKFAAAKLDMMMKVYPGRVFSKPEFTALPSYIFSGAEFALIPSRDEPFGLVAVEFGRKGALGVGARVGGLGQMPGWWYTIESTSTRHLLQQFKGAIEGALASRTDVRAVLRARSGNQRFPVAQWMQDLETLQSTAIKRHKKFARKHEVISHDAAIRRSTSLAGQRTADQGVGPGAKRLQKPVQARSRASSPSQSVRSRIEHRTSYQEPPSPILPPTPVSPPSPVTPRDVDSLLLQRMGSRAGPGHGTHPSFPDWDQDGIAEEIEWCCYADSVFDLGSSETDADSHYRRFRSAAQVDDTAEFQQHNFLRLTPGTPSGRIAPALSGLALNTVTSSGLRGGSIRGLPMPWHSEPSRDKELPPLPMVHTEDEPTQPVVEPSPPSKRPGYYSSLLSSDAVVGEKKNFNLQRVDPFFTDPAHDYEQAFKRGLADLNGKNTYETMIEEFIVKSEKDWFNRLRDVKMGKSKTPVGSIFQENGGSTPPASLYGENLRRYALRPDWEQDSNRDSHSQRQFLLADDYKVPTGIKKFLLRRLGDWPVYSILLAFGQIIAANSYQITLLTGQVGQAAIKLYTIASIYLITSVMWWTLYRSLKSVWVLSLPFVLYGTAFFLIGMAPLVSGYEGKKWIQNVAIACYATASSSGSLFFALNFGDQGGAPGTQQIYIALLWWWGASVARASEMGTTSVIVSAPALASSIGVCVAILMWSVGGLLLIGLPDYYRQSPGQVPSFLMSVLRRKIVLWFFMMVLIQNFFLSAPYGRNWRYLWQSQHLQGWIVLTLVILFFVVIWAGMLYVASVLSKSHSWLLPILAIGLGAPRWCQMLWGVSGIGQYVPWAGGPMASAIAGRCLWLWLGVLDALQNVGFGMILLQTLTRFHVAFTLIVAQILGSITTIAARGFGLDKLGPGAIFPDFSANIASELENGWFWVGLFTQLLINALALKYFRKEQLSKP